MYKLRFMLLAILIMSVSFLVACGSDSASSEDPKQLIADAFNKSMEMNSFVFDGDFVISLDVDESKLDEDEQVAVSLLKDLNIAYRGAYQEDIEKMELIFETNLNLGDLKTVLEIPILIHEEKVWIKIPAIPGFVPDEFAGKQLELDLKQLAEMSGEEYVSIFDSADPQNQDDLSLVQNIIDIFVKNIDDSLFTVSKEEDTVVTVDFSGDKFYSTVETLFETSIPEFIKLVEEQQYANLLGLTPADIAELKELENGLPDDMKEEFNTLKEMLTVNKGELSFHINKDGFIDHQGMVIDISFTDTESDVDFALSISTNQDTSKINEEQEFGVEVPTQDIVDFSALFPMFMSMMGGFDSSMEMGGFDPMMEMEEDFSEMDEEMERVDELFYSLFEQEWFNDPQIQKLLFEDIEFQEAIYNEEVLEKLLSNETFRKSFFNEYGVVVE